MKKSRFSYGRVCRTSLKRDEKPVMSGLALTPSQIQRMSERGIPVSTQNLDGMFDDGVSRPSWDVPLDQQRGVDVATIWQRQKDAQSKLRSNYKDVVNALKSE